MEYVLSGKEFGLSVIFFFVCCLHLQSWGMPQEGVEEVPHGLALHLPPWGRQQDSLWDMATAKTPFMSNTWKRSA